jgi:hypothetical protein
MLQTVLIAVMNLAVLLPQLQQVYSLFIVEIIRKLLVFYNDYYIIIIIFITS